MKVTAVAADKIKDILKENPNGESLKLRVDIEGYGWGGPKLRLALDESTSTEDKVVESNGITIVYHSRNEEVLGNLEIDYEDSIMQRGFTIKGSESCC